MGGISPPGCPPPGSSRLRPPPPPRPAPAGAVFSSGLCFPGPPPPSGLRSSAHAEVGGWGSPRPAASARPWPPRSPAAAARRRLCPGPEGGCRVFGLCWTTEACGGPWRPGLAFVRRSKVPSGRLSGCGERGWGLRSIPAPSGEREKPRGQGVKQRQRGRSAEGRAERRWREDSEAWPGHSAEPSRAGPWRGQRPSAGSRRAPASVPAPPPSRWLSAVHSSLGKTLNEPQIAGKRSKKPPGEGAGAARGVRAAAPQNRPGSQRRPGVRGSSREHPNTSGPFYVPRRLQKRQRKFRPRLLFALGLSGRYPGPARRDWAESGRTAPLRTPRGAPGTLEGAKSGGKKLK